MNQMALEATFRSDIPHKGSDSRWIRGFLIQGILKRINLSADIIADEIPSFGVMADHTDVAQRLKPGRKCLGIFPGMLNLSLLKVVTYTHQVCIDHMLVLLETDRLVRQRVGNRYRVEVIPVVLEMHGRHVSYMAIVANLVDLV
jgi:hypothetical protein